MREEMSKPFDSAIADNPNSPLVSLLEELLTNTRNFKQSEAGRRFFETLVFIKQSRYLAPFNAMLVKQQRPEASFALSEDRWWKCHQRKPRPGAHPIIVMIPFGPVDFIYDIKDIEGIDKHPVRGCFPNLPTEELCRRLFPSSIIPPDIDNMLKELILNCSRQGLDFRETPLPIGLAGRVSLRQARMNRDEIKATGRPLYNYEMEVNSTHPVEIRFAAMVHELAHVFCEHLNEFDVAQFQRKTKEDREFEAEAAAYLLCYRHGLRPKSEQYLAGYLMEGREPSLANFGVIITAVKKIEDLLKHEGFCAPPLMMEISIGGFLGKSYSLTCREGKILYEACGQGYQRESQTEIVPSPLQWGSFWKSCHQAGLWKWRENYTNREVVDGTHWAVRIHREDRQIISSGGNDYPGTERYPYADPYPPPFQNFLKAISKLIGGLPFG